MPTYRAAWIVPIVGTPISHGWVTVRAGRIVAVGGPPNRPDDAEVVDLGDVALMPALVNAHTHLELSWMRGRVAPGGSFVDWVSTLMRERMSDADADAQGGSRDRLAMRDALAELHASGTAAVGDVSNSLTGLDLLGERGTCGVLFHELLGFSVSDPRGFVASAVRKIASAPVPRGWRIVPAAHAPYSVSPALFTAVRRASDTRAQAPTGVHVAEGVEEVEFLATGGGRWRDLLLRLGAWDPAWTVPACSPVEYLDRLGFWAPRTLAVHAVQATPDDLARLRARDATVVTCPRSNIHVGAGAPPVESFYASGVRVAVGTDSLASVDNLNLFAELALLHRLAPGVAASRLLASATAEGARVLGLDAEFGTLEAGKRASIISLRVPRGIGDVEQYLVDGIEPGQIRWIEGGQPC